MDNASEDDSVAKLREISDERLKVYINKEDIGPFRNWYKALSKGMGRYVMLLNDGDDIVVENLPLYLKFLRNSEYDIIKNAYKNREHISGTVSVAHMQYYGKIFSHTSYLTYKRETFSKLKPMECSFDTTFCAYPYFIWETQILKAYPIYEKKSYINGKIEIVKLLEKRVPSRTRVYMDKQVPSSYTFDNAVYMFDKQAGLLRKLYPDDKLFCKMYCNLYRGDLMLGTFRFYEHMNNPKMKQRYMPEMEEKDINYLELNNVFLTHASQMIQFESNYTKRLLEIKLYIITCRNRILFKLNHVYKRKFWNPPYFIGCIINRGLTYVVNIIT